MICSLSFQQTNHLLISLDEGVRSKNSLLRRFHFTVNWETALHFSNVAFMIAGIAYGFFMYLPWLSIGLTAYGIFYVVFSQKVQIGGGASARYSELQKKLHNAEDDGIKLNEKIQSHLRASGQSERAKRDQKKIDRIKEQRVQVKSQRKRLKVHKKQLEDEIYALKR